MISHCSCADQSQSEAHEHPDHYLCSSATACEYGFIGPGGQEKNLLRRGRRIDVVNEQAAFHLVKTRPFRIRPNLRAAGQKAPEQIYRLSRVVSQIFNFHFWVPAHYHETPPSVEFVTRIVVRHRHRKSSPYNKFP